ncbi:MAG: T9SS type A sorting domain-containing protein, partial [Crocinitomicaceae bacterium]|nr:T9SS type A sorting domain-containing protein [Crocinitomicaceae bacterium]
MRKIYLSLTAVISMGTILAQSPIVGHEKAIVEKGFITPNHSVKQNIISPKSTVFWANDFSDPTEWSKSNTSSPDADWEITSTFPSNLVTEGFDAPAHASAANGYAIINSDIHGQNGTQDAYLEINDAIDLSSIPNVSFQFSTYHRRFTPQTDQYFVEFSIDGGATYPPSLRLELNQTTGTNTTSPNPDIVTANVSNLIGGEADVKFRFHYIGEWGWFWTLDDIKLIEPEDYDLTTHSGEFFIGDMSFFHNSLEDGVEYYRIPTSQISPVKKFSAVVENVGALPQTEAVLNVDILDANNAVLQTLSGNPFAIAVAQSDTFSINQSYTFPGNDDYTFRFYASPDETDQNPSNDFSLKSPVLVGTNAYGRDNGQATSVLTNSQTNSGNTMKAGNLFEFFGTMDIASVDIAIANNQDYVGQLIYVEIWKYNTLTEDLEYVMNTSDYEIQAGDVGGFISVPMIDENGTDGTITANSGETYLVMAGHYGGIDVGFLMAQSVNDRSALFFDAANQLGFFQDMNALMIRPSSVSYLNTNELTSTNFKLNAFPNPAENQTTIAFELENSSDVSITVTDMSGKVVFNETVFNAAAGKNELNISTANFANGMYFLNLSS